MPTELNNNKRIAKNTAFLYLRMIVVMIVSLFTSRITLSVLGVSDYGVYNVVGGTVSMLSVLTGAISVATGRYLTYALGLGDMNGLKKVFSTANDEEAQRLLSEKGIELSVQETEKLLDGIAKVYARNQNREELSEEELEEVGGGFVGTIVAIVGVMALAGGASFYLGYRLGKMRGC